MPWATLPTSLVELDLSNNRLAGSLDGFPHFPNTTDLRLNSNGLGSTIPANLSWSPALTTLDLSSNSLLGGIPTGLPSAVQARAAASLRCSAAPVFYKAVCENFDKA